MPRTSHRPPRLQQSREKEEVGESTRLRDGPTWQELLFVLEHFFRQLNYLLICSYLTVFMGGNTQKLMGENKINCKSSFYIKLTKILLFYMCYIFVWLKCFHFFIIYWVSNLGCRWIHTNRRLLNLFISMSFPCWSFLTISTTSNFSVS